MFLEGKGHIEKEDYRLFGNNNQGRSGIKAQDDMEASPRLKFEREAEL